MKNKKGQIVPPYTKEEQKKLDERIYESLKKIVFKKTRIWDDKSLEKIRILTNKDFPESPVNSIKRVKAIIIKEEKKRGMTVLDHNLEHFCREFDFTMPAAKKFFNLT